MDCVDAFSRTEAAGCYYWLLLLVAAVDCRRWLLLLIAAAGCCRWLLLLVAVADCCCWLLSLIAAAGCCRWLLLLISAAPKVFDYFRDIFDDLRLTQFAGEKVFEYFRVVGERSLNISGLLENSLWIFSGCWPKVFEYFRVVGGKSLNISRIMMGEKWKRGSPRGSKLESEWILWLCAGYLYSIFQDGRRLSESQ